MVLDLTGSKRQCQKQNTGWVHALTHISVVCYLHICLALVYYTATTVVLQKYKPDNNNAVTTQKSQWLETTRFIFPLHYTFIMSQFKILLHIVLTERSSWGTQVDGKVIIWNIARTHSKKEREGDIILKFLARSGNWYFLLVFNWSKSISPRAKSWNLNVPKKRNGNIW